MTEPIRQYIRWHKDEPRAGRHFPPLREDHASYTRPCAKCGNPLGGGGSVQLVAIGPEDEDGRHRHEAGRFYCAVAVECHALCIAPLSKDELEEFAIKLESEL